MSAFPPPTYYFTNINFNSSYFESDNTGLTTKQANALYLQKTVSDTATALESFTAGILTNTISPTTDSSIMNIGATSTGEINLGTLGGRSAVIHIGDGNNNIAGSAVHINNGTNTASNVQILNGTGSTGTITLGSSTSTTRVNSILTLERPLVLGTAPTLNTQLGFTLSNSFNAAPLTAGTVTIVSSHQITTAGLYLVNWNVQYAGTTPTYWFSNVANTTTALLTTPTISGGTNWGNATVGTISGTPYQSTFGSRVISVVANNYLNLTIRWAGSGVAQTQIGFFDVTRIA